MFFNVKFYFTPCSTNFTWVIFKDSVRTSH